jgi:hypothetical protein
MAMNFMRFVGVKDPTSFASYMNFLFPIISTIRTIGNHLGFGGDFNVELRDVQIQSSTYGRILPIISGQARVAGNVIWASQVTKTSTREFNGLKEGTYTNKVSYHASFAIAICMGEISSISSIYGNDVKIDDMSNITIYLGSEDQKPNSTMQRYLGIDSTPAFRGVVYVVFDTFCLDDYHGNIPNFTFDITNIETDIPNSAGNLVSAINIIPGTGEFVYDTKIQYKRERVLYNNQFVGYSNLKAINMNNNQNIADSILSVNDMKQSMQNVKWISLVSCWFGSNLDIKYCNIDPKVESHDILSYPDQWSVAGLQRSNAQIVSRDSDGDARYGGTPDDASIIRYLDYIKSQDLKTCFYPMIMMDLDGKPWRGRISGNASYVQNFFTKQNGYNNFILHYANLLKGKIDAFIIGSEMIGLTKIKDSNGSFPAVKELINLAKEVKKILGKDVKVTYAADWSEYHHTDGGWYNLDDLWASPDIDVIGIDAYFPLTDQSSDISVQDIENGWTSGEGYDFYFENGKGSAKKDLSAPYAWKNIKYFWGNAHYNPDGKKTSWIPKSKKIWFTEYGFPSINLATNQPNVFYSKSSSESGFPYLSDGKANYSIQQKAIIATEVVWKSSPMIENKFAWCWDARPFPYFPNLSNTWKDAGDFATGHWLNGKIASSTLNQVIYKICISLGLKESEFKIEDDLDYIIGININTKTSGIALLKHLSEIFMFDISMINGIIVFYKIKTRNIVKIDDGNILKIDVKSLNKNDTPSVLEMLYYNQNYKITNARFSANDINQNTNSIKTNVIISDDVAKSVAQSIITSLWNSEDEYKISLPITFNNLKLGDTIELFQNNKKSKLRIISIQISKDDVVNITCINQHDFSSNDVLSHDKKIADVEKKHDIELDIFDLPNIDQSTDRSKFPLYLGIRNDFEQDLYATIKLSSDNGVSYQSQMSIDSECIYGDVFDFHQSSEINKNIVDYKSKFKIYIRNGEISSTDEISFHNDVNLCIIGDEILSFKNAEIIGENLYQISVLLRGLYGTNKHINTHKIGDKFTLIKSLSKLELPMKMYKSNLLFKAIYPGQKDIDAKTTTYQHNGNAFLPISPSEIKYTKSENGDIIISWNHIGIKSIDISENIDIDKNKRYNLYVNDKIIANDLYDTSFILTSQMQISKFGHTLTTIDSINLYAICDVF